MIDLTLIGIGTGNPDHLTAQARRAMAGADLILLPRKGSDKADLIDLRRTLCAGLEGPGSSNSTCPCAMAPPPISAPSTTGTRRSPPSGAPKSRHTCPRAAASPCSSGAIRCSTTAPCGSPAAGGLATGGMELTIRVVPGITSIQALCAAHAIPLNPLGGAVTITTARMLRRHGWPQGATCVVVMLDDGTTLETLPPEGITVWWGAYLGMEAEALDHGPLALAAPRIARLRAQLRARHGWIMDISLLKKDQTDA
jgi:precorrin-6A synthase